MRKTLLFIALIFFFSQAKPQNTASIDVKHYTIKLAVNYDQKDISGSTVVRFTSLKDNLSIINLSLLELLVDSIAQHGKSLSFNYDDTTLLINLSTSMSSGQNDSIEVFYGGTPEKDPSGFGGFYFNNNYAFNLGVAFQSDPHNYGRVWFPCKDNFTDRALYSFEITTADNKKAFCNGLLKDSINNNDGTVTWKWEMDESIPTYLASVAVAGYATVRLMHQGINKKYPILYAVLPKDSAKMRKSFVHIHDCLNAYEHDYGPYKFDRVGFTVVPFNGGAMEHATNIAYPLFAVNGNTKYETLWAHELSHHWWGDLITCRTEGDMWINEGWASYSEKIFAENIYGRKAYLEKVMENHKNVLMLAHIQDGKPLPVSPVPHENTYGMTVYDKGADVAHTLRTYLGDSLFFSGIKRLMKSFAFKDISSIDIRDSLSYYTGIDLTEFFNKWVFNPGFPHFSIYQSSVEKNGNNYEVKLSIQQKLRFAPGYYNDVPLEITFMDKNWNKITRTIKASGKMTDVSIGVPIEPLFIGLDIDGLISDAITSGYMTINKTGDYNFDNALMTIHAENVVDSAFLFIQHHWVPPDDFKNGNPGIRLNPYRYWSVDGLIPQKFEASGEIQFSVRDSLDNRLGITNEDSIVLLYRAKPTDNWEEYPDYEINNLVIKNDGFGKITIKDIKFGEYVLGMRDVNELGVKDARKKKELITVFPNPTQNKLIVKLNSRENDIEFYLYDMEGKVITRKLLKSKTAQVEIPTLDMAPGTYLIKAFQEGKEIYNSKIILAK